MMALICIRIGSRMTALSANVVHFQVLFFASWDTLWMWPQLPFLITVFLTGISIWFWPHGNHDFLIPLSFLHDLKMATRHSSFPAESDQGAMSAAVARWSHFWTRFWPREGPRTWIGRKRKSSSEVKNEGNKVVDSADVFVIFICKRRKAASP